jgi:hypothetical protein
MNAATAHAVMDSTRIPPSRCHPVSRRRRSDPTPTATIAAHRGISHHRPQPGGSRCISQVSATTRVSLAPGGWPADGG